MENTRASSLENLRNSSLPRHILPDKLSQHVLHCFHACRVGKGIMPQDDSCLSAIISSSVTGAAFGTVAGSALANWGDVPKVVRNKSWPALKETGEHQDIQANSWMKHAQLLYSRKSYDAQKWRCSKSMSAENFKYQSCMWIEAFRQKSVQSIRILHNVYKLRPAQLGKTEHIFT